jgi:uncharacterized protein
MNAFQAKNTPVTLYPLAKRALSIGISLYGDTGQPAPPARFFLLLLINCYLPILLIWSGVIPFAYRFYVLAVVLTSFLVFGLRQGYRFRDLGYTLDKFGDALRWNLLVCAFGGIGLYLTYRTGVFMPREYSYSLACFLFYIFILAPVQELIFRGILFAEMKRCQIVDPKAILLISTTTFSFLHIIYNHPPLLLITFISGFIWGMSYLRWPSLWGVSLSHSLLGALAMFLGVL